MLTFKDFLHESRPGIGPHGENSNDKSEKAMINRIIEICFTNVKSDENYATAYDFLESDWGGALWDKYYELFHQKKPDFEGPQDKPRFTRFKTETKAYFKKWQNKAKFTGTPVTEDVFVAGDGELRAAVNTGATHARASEPGKINTNLTNRLRVTTSNTGGTPVYYAFSYVHDKTSTDLLTSIKGKGPYTLDDVRRHKFLEDTATYIAGNLKKAGLTPDVITAPKSSSNLLHEFAGILADKLNVKTVHLAAYHKKEHKLPADRQEAMEYIKAHFVDHAMLDAKYHGDEREAFEDEIAKGLYYKLKNGGPLDAKKVHKPHAKFVKGYYDVGDLDDTLDGKTVLVVDDIQSSGSTMNDVFRIARDLGAAKVFGAVIFNRTTASH